ncbi:hypothetical protein ACG98G_05775 [Megasphaera hexanoica]|uniref:Phage tail protein n=1 Tax=Megasphaera hexanoica TaxID=1675036 RepID=A0ABW7DQ97_9FIRM
MSILKGILHHWNKTSSSYDTIHPETESAQITDWDAGIGATLAKTTLGSLITTLSSDSFAAKVVKMVLDATGVKYSMGTNGYFCFGSLFGGLIIQWGNGYGYSDPDTNNASYYIKYPIVMDKVLIGLSQVSSEVNDDIYVRFIKKNGKFFLLDTDSSNDNIPCEWIVLGYVK